MTLEEKIIEDRAKALHIDEATSVNGSMEDLFTRTATLLTSAATALDSQWCEKDKNELLELAKAFRAGIKCCSESTFNIEFSHNKDGEYVRCRKCGWSYGSAVGFLVSQRLAAEENHKLFYENAHLKAEIDRFIEEVEKESRRLYEADKADGIEFSDYTREAMQTVREKMK